LESTEKAFTEDGKPLIWTGEGTLEGVCHKKKKDLFLQQNVENRAVNSTASEETEPEAHHHSKSVSQCKLLSNSLSKRIVKHLPSLLLEEDKATLSLT